jgi:hypothetical protein
MTILKTILSYISIIAGLIIAIIFGKKIKDKGKVYVIEKEVDDMSDSDILDVAGAGDLASSGVNESRIERDDRIRGVLSRLGRKGRDMGDNPD